MSVVLRIWGREGETMGAEQAPAQAPSLDFLTRKHLEVRPCTTLATQASIGSKYHVCMVFGARPSQLGIQAVLSTRASKLNLTTTMVSISLFDLYFPFYSHFPSPHATCLQQHPRRLHGVDETIIEYI